MFKVAGPMWAQAAAGDNALAKLVKAGKKVLRRVWQQGEPPRVDIPKPTWRLLAQPQTCRVSQGTSRRLIGGLFPRQALKTQAADVRRQAALRLVRESRKVPVFALVGLSLGLGGQQTAVDGEVLCSGIRELFEQYSVKGAGTELAGQQFSLETLDFGKLIGQGCNAAVYEARLSSKATEEPEEQVTEVDESVEIVQTAGVCGCSLVDTQSSVNNQEDSPPLQFHTEDHVSEIEDDDFIILDEEDLESEPDKDGDGVCNDGMLEDHLAGWVMCRVSSTNASSTNVSSTNVSCTNVSSTNVSSTNADPHQGGAAAGLSHSDTGASSLASDSNPDSDFYILAYDEGGVESVPGSGWDMASSVLYEQTIFNMVYSETDDSSTTGADSTCSSESVELDSSSSSDCDHDQGIPNVIDPGSPSVIDPGSVADLDPGSPNDLDPGCLSNGSQGDFDLAVKMMYNYSVESAADRILTAMAREAVPAQQASRDARGESKGIRDGLQRLPPHPNVVAMHGVFVDQTLDLPGSMALYPSALPPRLNHHNGFGRNATMFLVMKKYDVTLRQYLATHTPSVHTCCLLFAQLLEGAAHLSDHSVAHRDLKADNILLNLSEGPDWPQLAISDFGCCLADPAVGLKLPYPVRDVDRGGNAALMAPEIKCAEPGEGVVLDYSKADLWAVGALAAEIFGGENPFYKQLDARIYEECDLPALPDTVPQPVQGLIKLLLRRNPDERPSASCAASALQVALWAPAALQPWAPGARSVWRGRALAAWLETLAAEMLLRNRVGPKMGQLERQLKSVFLARVQPCQLYSLLSLNL